MSRPTSSPASACTPSRRPAACRPRPRSGGWSRSRWLGCAPRADPFVLPLEPEVAGILARLLVAAHPWPSPVGQGPAQPIAGDAAGALGPLSVSRSRARRDWLSNRLAAERITHDQGVLTVGQASNSATGAPVACSSSSSISSARSGPKYCRMEVRAWSGTGWWELVLPGGGVGQVEPAGAVQGLLGGADREPAWQHRVPVTVPARQPDGEPP